MPRPDTILAERHKLGPVEHHALSAGSLAGAHRALGALLADRAVPAIEKRLSTQSPDKLSVQMANVRACRGFMESRGAHQGTAGAVRNAIQEYFTCLDAWGGSVGVSADVALWAQDDNTGCQTGMRRQADGSVLFWHTEEDTIGYFDKPRTVAFQARDGSRAAFLYPYLMPGPAFGWQREQLHAVDSLFVRRKPHSVGAFTSVASWLVWRLGPEIPVRETLRALLPYADGCAIVVARPSARGVSAEIHEIGGAHLQSRALGKRKGSLEQQANAVSRKDSPLGREEALRARERAPYEARVRRAHETLAKAGELAAGDILRNLAGRRGNTYANANLDVKGHCVAHVSTSGIEIHVGSGAAHRDDVLALKRVS